MMPLQTPRWLQGFAFLALTAISALGQPVTNAVFAARAQAAFLQARQAFAEHPTDTNAAWQLGRATYDWAEFSTNSDQRAAIARAGIAACRALLVDHPGSAAGHYYLGMDYGELAQAEAPSLAAYRLIRDIEQEFKTAVGLDEKFDYGGPLRCLGLLYRDAPGWPLSIGSKHDARDYLHRAAAAAPDFPENQLNLIETHVQWGEADDAEAAWRKLSAIWPAAQTNLTGVAWESSWADWKYRRATVRASFQKAFDRPLPP